MTASPVIRPARVTGFISALVLFGLPAHAQLGGLIKKKLDRATGKEEVQAGQPVVFDAVTLEITQERIEKLTAAKRAARKHAEEAAAYAKQIESLDARQAAIYEKQVNNINGWDEKRRDYERCRDSVLSEIHDRKNAQTPDAAVMRRMMELAQAMAVAQQKRDTAEIRKITEQIERTKAPTKADSAEAAKLCPYPVQPAVVKEWLGLKQQLDSLTNQKQEAESQVAKTEAAMSGMNPRQSAIFCERIKLYVQQLKEKKKHAGFSDDEVKRLADLEQAIKDLETLCP